MFFTTSEHARGKMSKRAGNKMDYCSPKELRVVLLGKHHSGKTSVINTVLQSSETAVKVSTDVKTEGFIDGRRICLIESPGWWKTFNLTDLSNISKQQLIRRISLISPGPHAVLIVIRADRTFTDTDAEFLEKSVDLLGENIWTHSLIIFTRGDLVKQEDIKRKIQESALSRIIGKCENKYQVFNNINPHDQTQVKELIGKIEGIVEKNGKHFDIDQEKVREVKEQLEEIQTRAISRKCKVEQQRSTVQEKACVRRLEEIRLVLLGWVLAGKSSAGNIILNQDEFITGGKTRATMKGFRKIEGRKVSVLDTPGWWKYLASELNPDFITSAILESISECEKFPHAFLLVIPADTSFQKEQKRIVEENMSILGEDVWRHTIVLFTWGDRLSDISIEQHIESEGEALQWLIEKCRNRYHVFNNINKENQAQVSELLRKIDEMVAENSLFVLNTEKTPVKTDGRADNQEEVIIRLKDFHCFLDAGFKLKAQEIRLKIEKLFMHVMEEPLNADESQSKEFGVTFTDQKTPYDSHQPPKVNNPPQQDNIPEQIKALLEREFSRWESIIIDGVRESLQDIKSSFELSQTEKRIRSMDAVEMWLENYYHYIEHTIDKIQEPESGTKRKRLKTQ
ncbi:GTPase IMAP family member 8 isoform X1 [Danio rerio]|uniref:GTPase IMAP family member 8 isoform X1 n=4 Tax=Danio rerio TaxID=7955 RepID=A0A8M9QID3_DANRE|nr:GTPase IMAP family member 8-like isoform X1 [Danio rerio]|eukprot:XP_021335601.1 GTPase IMAP family member 8-like isoform X1 [Danio rerio]